ncbi:MAG: alpha-L-rhamnosidase N-terminal domain-containing protein [Bacteroidales bacterium]|nr:alpha-L-rhamnosidase N-terminal domain-containing protein [Bacteroidales bacterium]
MRLSWLISIVCFCALTIRGESPVANVINFVRLTEPRSLIEPVLARFTDEYLFLTTRNQLSLCDSLDIKATWLLQYDALCSDNYQQLMAQAIKKGHEVGLWWEITEPHVEAAGIPWRGRFPWDWHANVGFSIGYSPEQRLRLVDVAMTKFKEVFGEYPRSVGSWFIDAKTLDYMQSKYGVKGAAVCRDQIGTDGYNLWGGYWQGGYFPSKNNFFIPAQNPENQINVATFRMLGSDPIRQYESGLGGRHQDVATLEPVYPAYGGNNQWVDWYLKQLYDTSRHGLVYTQVGQENSFGWDAINSGLRCQLAELQRLSQKGKIRIETLGTTSERFLAQHATTPLSVTTTRDPYAADRRQAIWVNGPRYRAHLIVEEDGRLSIRDIHLFDESWQSAYLDSVCTSSSCFYFTPALFDGNCWSDGTTPARIAIVTAGKKGEWLESHDKIHCKDFPDHFQVRQGPLTMSFYRDSITISAKNRPIRLRPHCDWSRVNGMTVEDDCLSGTFGTMDWSVALNGVETISKEGITSSSNHISLDFTNITTAKSQMGNAQWIGAPWQGEEPSKSAGPEPYCHELGASPWLRGSFRLTKSVAKATARVTGLGYFEFWVNGKRVGDDYFVPAFTCYGPRNDLKYYPIAIEDTPSAYRVVYLEYDITPMVQTGDNVAGLWLGNGFYDSTTGWVSAFGSPRGIVRIDVIYPDGTVDQLVTDSTWQAKPSPIGLNGTFEGEIYDARLDNPEWCTTGDDSPDWQPVAIRKDPEGKLQLQDCPTDKITSTWLPDSVTCNGTKSYTFHFPEEIAGRVYLKNIRGQRGDTINIIYHNEMPQGVNHYVIGDSIPNEYAPRFSWWTFSNVTIEGLDDLPEVIAQAINTDIPVVGHFSCSNEVINKLLHAWQRTQLDNFHGGIASDCPQREHAPYTGDGQVVMPMVLYNFDAVDFYRKWLRDMRDAQIPETGYVPNGAPWQPGCGGGPAWGAAMSLMPWDLYRWTGDLQDLLDNFDAMERQAQYMLSWQLPDGTMLAQRANVGSTEPMYWLNLGDWCAPGDLPNQNLVHTFYLWLCADRVAQAANALGFSEKASQWLQIATDVKQAFHTKFYNPEVHSYGNCGGDVFALAMGLPPHKDDKTKVSLSLVLSNLIYRCNRHLDTGIYASRYLGEVLADRGHIDLALDLITQPTYPSPACWLSQGSTTFWEKWDGADSHNHPMFGALLTFLYSRLTGLRLDLSQPGLKHAVIAPILSEDVAHVEYERKGWKIHIDHSPQDVTLRVTVPEDCSATVMLPWPLPCHASTEIPLNEGSWRLETHEDGRVVVQPDV